MLAAVSWRVCVGVLLLLYAPALNGAYDFFMNEVTTAYLFPEVVQFNDAVSILGAGNPNIVKVDITKMIDRTFIQSAQDRKLGG